MVFGGVVLVVGRKFTVIGKVSRLPAESLRSLVTLPRSLASSLQSVVETSRLVDLLNIIIKEIENIILSEYKKDKT